LQLKPDIVKKLISEAEKNNYLKVDFEKFS
jgi:hypothetical protein